MKKLIERISFSFRFAYKNVINSKFRSIIILITFIILTILSIMAFSTKTFLYQYFNYDYFNKYNDIDFYLSYDENTNARYFSIRELNNNEEIKNELKYMAPFFEFTTLIDSNDNLDYVQIYASSLDNLKLITKSKLNVNTLNSQEIIITETISKQFNLKSGDNIDILLGDTKTNYTVVDIIKDNGLFQKATVFIDKDLNMNYILEAFGLGNIDPRFTKNLYNRIYFSLKDDSKIELVKRNIQELPVYQNYVLVNTINEDIVNEEVINYGSILYLAFTFIIFAVIQVIQTTFHLIFNDRQKQIALLKILGGRTTFNILALIIELILYFVPSTIIATYFTDYIINNGLNYIGSTFIFHVSIGKLLISFGFVFLILFILLIKNYRNLKKVSIITLSKTNSEPSSKISQFNIILIIICVIAYILNNYLFSNLYKIEFKALINIIISFISLFVITKVLLLLLKILFKNKKGLFSLIIIKNLNSNKIIKHTISVFILSMLLIIYLLGVNKFVTLKSQQLKKQFNIDFVLTNIIHNYDLTYEELKTNTNIKDINKAHFLSNTILNEYNITFHYHFSTNSNNLSDYFNINLSPDVINQFNDGNKPQVLIPIKFHYLYNLNIGDKVSLNLNKTSSNESFFIAGFIDLGFSDIIITNINNIESYQDFKPNAIILNYKTNQKQEKNNLITRYSGNMYYILDFNQLLNNMINNLSQITSYFSYLIFILIFCFMLTIFNNSLLEFTHLKPLFSRLRVLGCSVKRLIRNIIYEKLVTLLLVSVSLLAVIPIIKKNLAYVLIFYGTYETFNFTNSTIIIGLLIGSMMFIISYIFYIIKIININSTEVLKY